MPNAFDSRAARVHAATRRVFGEPDVTYTPKSGAPYLLNDGEPAGELEFPDAIQEGEVPEYARFFLRADLLAAPAVKGDRLEIDGTDYIVIGSREAGDGAIRLLLDKVN